MFLKTKKIETKNTFFKINLYISGTKINLRPNFTLLKRFFAITLLCIHLFYIGGYTLLFQYYIHKADVQMVKQVFDNKIDDTKLIEIKIPVHFPTMTDWTDYEFVAGQIQLKDAFYNYVRLKMTKDTMYYVCLPNTTKTRLVNANIITAKEISDVPLNKNSHNPVVKKVNQLSDYNLHSFEYQYAEYAKPVKSSNTYSITKLSNPFIESPGKPPNFSS